MEETYWNKFAASGRVTDYLQYRGIAVCADVMRRHETKEAAETEETYIESGNFDGNGTLIDTDWRIR